VLGETQETRWSEEYAARRNHNVETPADRAVRELLSKLGKPTFFKPLRKVLISGEITWVCPSHYEACSKVYSGFIGDELSISYEDIGDATRLLAARSFDIFDFGEGRRPSGDMSHLILAKPRYKFDGTTDLGGLLIEIRFANGRAPKTILLQQVVSVSESDMTKGWLFYPDQRRGEQPVGTIWVQFGSDIAGEYPPWGLMMDVGWTIVLRDSYRRILAITIYEDRIRITHADKLYALFSAREEVLERK
jgi:hypothetical protein